MQANTPTKLYRYAEAEWLKRSLLFGEFRLSPASWYKHLEGDVARRDDELLRTRSTDGARVKIIDCSTGQEIKPIGEVTYWTEIGTDYLMLCFSKMWDEKLFEVFSKSDSCLVIHNVDEFRERIHAAAEAKLLGWAGLDVEVSYDRESPFGASFSKPLQFIFQHEWKFAWLPPSRIASLDSLTITIGNIQNIAEVIEKPPTLMPFAANLTGV